MTADSQLALLARARSPKRHAHRFMPWYNVWKGESYIPSDHEFSNGRGCMVCRISEDDYLARQRRGRSSLRAGKDAERAIAKVYGGRRTGQYGGPDDVVVGELFVVQSKAGRGWFREAVWDELHKLSGSQRIPTLIVSDRPGPGRKTRRYVIRTLEDDVALHGEKP